MIQLQDGTYLCIIRRYFITTYIPKMICILSGSVLDRLYMYIVLYHRYPPPISYMLSGSVKDRLYRDIVLYHIYPAPIMSILSGFVLDRLYRDFALYHEYPTLIMSILGGSVLLVYDTYPTPMSSILSGSIFDTLFKQIIFCTWQTVNDVTDSSLRSVTASETSSTVITSEKNVLWKILLKHIVLKWNYTRR